MRCHCDGCGHDVLIAFSCKHRGLCPSCGARRMVGEAAQVVDRVVPNVPLRQWVLSLPWELRGLAATRAKVFSHPSLSPERSRRPVGTRYVITRFADHTVDVARRSTNELGLSARTTIRIVQEEKAER